MFLCTLLLHAVLFDFLFPKTLFMTLERRLKFSLSFLLTLLFVAVVVVVVGLPSKPTNPTRDSPARPKGQTSE